MDSGVQVRGASWSGEEGAGGSRSKETGWDHHSPADGEHQHQDQEIRSGWGRKFLGEKPTVCFQWVEEQQSSCRPLQHLQHWAAGQHVICLSHVTATLPTCHLPVRGYMIVFTYNHLNDIIDCYVSGGTHPRARRWSLRVASQRQPTVQSVEHCQG